MRQRAPGKGLAYTGWGTIDLVSLQPGEAGFKPGVTRGVLYEATCTYGHRTRAGHEQAPPDTAGSDVELSEWRLWGPRLGAVVVLLTVRYRLSRVKVRELLAELFGLEVPAGLADQTIREAGRAVALLESDLVAEIEQAVLVHADETSWREAGQARWLWVFVTAQTVLCQIGYRAREIVMNVLPVAFRGELMPMATGPAEPFRTGRAAGRT